jgi:hypothetical protein
MRSLGLLAGAVAIGLSAASTALAAPIAYEFVEADQFDSTTNGNSGANQTLTNGVDSVKLTSVDILVPQFAATSPFAPTGTILSAVDGTRTNFQNLGQLGVNNPSIGDTNYQNTYGPSGEAQSFNKDEAWIFEFDKDVKIEQLNWASVDGTDQITITVEDVAASYVLNDGATNDDYNDPLAGLIIPAGKNITIKATHPGYDGTSRLDSITVSIPEPTGVGLAALGGIAFLSRRGRRN